MINPKKMTDEQLRYELKMWSRAKRTATQCVKVLITELLRRKREEIHDGYWTPWGHIDE